MPKKKKGIKGRGVNVLKLESSREFLLLNVFESLGYDADVYWKQSPILLVWCTWRSKLSYLYKTGHRESKNYINHQFEERYLVLSTINTNKFTQP